MHITTEELLEAVFSISSIQKLYRAVVSVRAVRQKNVVIGPGTKNDCTGEGKEQFTRPDQTRRDQARTRILLWASTGMTLLAKASSKLPDQTKPVSHHLLITGAAELGTSRENSHCWKLLSGSQFVKT
jgi:hypothetical protein